MKGKINDNSLMQCFDIITKESRIYLLKPIKGPLFPSFRPCFGSKKCYLCCGFIYDRNFSENVLVVQFMTRF